MVAAGKIRDAQKWGDLGVPSHDLGFSPRKMSQKLVSLLSEFSKITGEVKEAASALESLVGRTDVASALESDAGVASRALASLRGLAGDLQTAGAQIADAARALECSLDAALDQEIGEVEARLGILRAARAGQPQPAHQLAQTQPLVPLAEVLEDPADPDAVEYFCYCVKDGWYFRVPDSPVGVDQRFPVIPLKLFKRGSTKEPQDPVETMVIFVRDRLVLVPGVHEICAFMNVPDWTPFKYSDTMGFFNGFRNPGTESFPVSLSVSMATTGYAREYLALTEVGHKFISLVKNYVPPGRHVLTLYTDYTGTIGQGFKHGYGGVRKFLAPRTTECEVEVDGEKFMRIIEMQKSVWAMKT